MLTTRFCHVHVPRTGGTTLRAFLGTIPGAGVIESAAHLPYDHMVEVCRRAGYSVPPAFAFVRHPWSWYVSQWRWQWRHGRPGVRGKNFEQYMQLVKDNEKGQIGKGKALNYAPLCRAWCHIGAHKVQYVGRFEDFQDEVVRILLAVVPDLVTEAQVRSLLKGAGHRRKGDYGDYRRYYTAGLRRWVARVDAALIEKFGYSFEA